MQYSGFYDAVNGSPSYSAEDMSYVLNGIAGGSGVSGFSATAQMDQSYSNVIINIGEGFAINNGEWFRVNGVSETHRAGTQWAYVEFGDKEAHIVIEDTAERPEDKLVLGRVGYSTWSYDATTPFFDQYTNHISMASNSAAMAYSNAISAQTTARSAYNQANNAYNEANSLRSAANIYMPDYGNTDVQTGILYSMNTAQNAYTQANSAFYQANAAYDQAVLAYGQAEDAYNLAEQAFQYGNNRKNEVGAAVTAKGGTWASTYDWNNTVNSIASIPSGGGEGVTEDIVEELCTYVYSPIYSDTKFLKTVLGRSRTTGSGTNTLSAVNMSYVRKTGSKYKYIYSIRLDNLGTSSVPYTLEIGFICRNSSYQDTFISKKTVVFSGVGDKFTGTVELLDSEIPSGSQDYLSLAFKGQGNGQSGWLQYVLYWDRIDPVGLMASPKSAKSSRIAAPDLDILDSLIEEAEQSGNTEELERLSAIREQFNNTEVD